MAEPLSSSETYEKYIYTLPQRFPAIQKSTLVYISSATLYGRVNGILFFDNDVTLCVQELLNFELSVISSYGYEVSHSQIPEESSEFPDVSLYCQASYPHKRKVNWYDSFPHPNDPTLASTHPHHKHVHPNIKRNRIPAPELSFTRPNLPFLITEVMEYIRPIAD